MIKDILMKVNKHFTFYFLIFLSIVSGILGMILPYLNGQFVDILVSAPNIETVCIWVALLILIGSINIGINYSYNFVSKKYINKLTYKLNLKAINHIWLLDYQKVCSFNLSYLMQRIYTDSNIVISFFIDNFVATLINAITIIILIAILWKINIYYLFISILFSVIYSIAFLLIRKNLSLKNLNCKNASNKYYSVMNTQLNNFEDVQIEADFEHSNKIIENSFLNFWNTLVPFLRLSQNVNSIDGIISLCFQSTSFLLGGYQVIKGYITIGEFTVLNTYFSILLSCIKYYFNFAKTYQETAVSYARLKEIFEIPLNITYESSNINLQSIESILLKNVSFKYNERIIINNLSADIQKNDLVAIIGNNGAGKSTLLKIIIGLIKPTDGEVRLNNIDLKSLNDIDFRKHYISFASQTISCEQVKVSEILEDFDFNKLEKYSFDIFKDDKFINYVYQKSLQDLSLGEKSKLLIIRAFSKEKPVVFLDEPTSNMDINSIENLIHYLINIKNKIVIYATHDEKLIKISNKIIKM